MIPLPEKVDGDSKLVPWLNRLLRGIFERTPKPGKGLLLKQYSDGFAYCLDESLSRRVKGLEAIPEYDNTATYSENDLVSYGSNRMAAATQLTMLQGGDGPGPGIYQALKTTTGNAPTGADSDTNWAQIVGFPLRCLSLKDADGRLIVVDASALPENTTLSTQWAPWCETVGGTLTNGYRWGIFSDFIAGPPPT